MRVEDVKKLLPLSILGIFKAYFVRQTDKLAHSFTFIQIPPVVMLSQSVAFAG